MKGLIESGQLVTVSPVDPKNVNTGDIVLCKVMGRTYLHLVKKLGQDGRFLIGNNKGRINGWCSPGSIFGIVTKIGE
jgi:SOS-response transcriptional repressor LexA